MIKKQIRFTGGEELFYRYACPTCDGDVTEWSRTCFGIDPHIDYRCDNWLCPWKGREPKILRIFDDDE